MYSVLSLVAAVFGVGLGALTGALLVRARASVRWPTTTGRVRAREIRDWWLGRSHWYAPRVEYEYQVEGQWYISDRLGFASRFPTPSSRKAAADGRAAFPDAELSNVRYDPANPRVAVLEPGVRPPLIALTVASVALLALAIAFALLARMREVPF